MFEPMFDLALPTLAMMVVATAFLALERIAPGRKLPHARLGGTGARSWTTSARSPSPSPAHRGFDRLLQASGRDPDGRRAGGRSPHWVKYFIQTPELHSIHHQLDVHYYNCADLPLWDRLF